ncbi:MAG: RdgB/HAM1 family non-canonical purine NTP pyrophosphatase [Planctomycetales bacterium]|nr:RdgB/HAM1 family non-canonical purine NTP pyrophosphatase [Planctomycetales bacterium]
MSPAALNLTIGTTNLAKGRELAELLRPHGFHVQTLKDFANPLAVVEDGQTFAANAQKKASQQAKHLGAWVLADDSGIEIDALGGKPGIYSARFAGEEATDEDNNEKLLAVLSKVPWEKRGAQYYCHVALADPSGAIRAESSGICRGRIRFEAAGTNGFGYDPLFEIVEYHRTFGELGPSVKKVISHRGRAMRAIVPLLTHLAGSGSWT